MKRKHGNIALIGLGYWGKNIFRNLNELNVLNMVCDINPGTIEDYKRQFPQIKYANSLRPVWSNKKIKAVLIATPAVTHFELAKEALLQGKDVFVEKPLALTEKEGRELVELAKKTHRILMVGHILQYHPAIIKLKEMIESGKLGKIQYIYSNRLNIGKLRIEENILWSFAPHDISVILMLMSEEPLRVSSFGGDYLSPGINDVTVTTLEFNNGVKGHIFVSWLHPFKEQKLVVVGSGGMAVFDDMAEEKLVIYPHKIDWNNGNIPVAQKAYHRVISYIAGEPLKLELKHFIECVEKRTQPKTSGEEGLMVLKVLEAADKGFVEHDSSLIHRTALVDEGCRIGEGTRIWHFSHIIKGSKIGKNCSIGQNVVIGPKVKIGDGCKIQNNVSIYEGVELEDYVFCGPSCVFTNVFNPRSEIPRMHEYMNTKVGRGASIGANATIVSGNSIGKYSFIGAGAVVTHDVPDYALVYGNPAKIMGWMCECGLKFKFKKNKTICKVCKRRYYKNKSEVKEIQ